VRNDENALLCPAFLTWKVGNTILQTGIFYADLTITSLLKQSDNDGDAFYL